MTRPWTRISLIGTFCYTLLLTSVALSAPDADGVPGAIISLAHPSAANFLHIPAYAVLAGLIMFTFRSLGIEIGKTIALAVIVSFLHGTFMEFFQAMIPGRYASASDGILNLIGIGSIASVYVSSLHFRFMAFLPVRS